MRPHDPRLLPSLHGWLTTLDSTPGHLLTPLQVRLSTCFDQELLQAAHASDEIRPESYQLANHAKGGIERTKSDSVLVSREKADYTTSRRLHAAFRIVRQTEGSSHNDAITQLEHNRNDDATKAQRPKRPHLTPLPTRNVQAAGCSSQSIDSQTSSLGIPEMLIGSVSEPFMRFQEPGEAHPEKLKASLKSSIKSVPKSAEETYADSDIDLTNAVGRHKPPCSLRRIKTVEFQDVEATDMRVVPPLKPCLSDTILNISHGHASQGDLTTKCQRVIKGEPSCSRLGTKSKLADPALTKTDVHIVTLTPTYTPETIPREPDLAAATPTMQIIKSADGRHEVIWDDVPAQDNKGLHRKTSVASWALHTVNSATKGGLEHVNSKLCEWNWSRGPGLEFFAPQVVVFPDDQVHAHAVTYMADDDENAAMRAPSNSQKTSGALSCSSSMPATTRPSRPPSQDESEATDSLGVNKSNDSGGGATAALSIPSSAQLGTIATLPDKFKKSQTDRRLSMTDDFEMKFRGHRDSVTIARSRLLHNRGLSPELLEVQKYASTTKGRRHARTRGKSEEEITNSRTDTREPLESIHSAFFVSSLPTSPGRSNLTMNRHSGDDWRLRGDSSRLPQQKSSRKGSCSQ